MLLSATVYAITYCIIFYVAVSVFWFTVLCLLFCKPEIKHYYTTKFGAIILPDLREGFLGVRSFRSGPKPLRGPRSEGPENLNSSNLCILQNFSKTGTGSLLDRKKAPHSCPPDLHGDIGNTQIHQWWGRLAFLPFPNWQRSCRFYWTQRNCS